MKDHFRPVGNPAPPRPRRPDFFISSMIASGPLSRIALVLSQAPRVRAPASRQSCKPYRLVKMRSLSASMVSLTFQCRQCGRAADRRRGLAIDLRSGLGHLAATEGIEHLLNRDCVEVLVEIVVDLHDRRIHAAAK